jgi:hypothetical protein
MQARVVVTAAPRNVEGERERWIYPLTCETLRAERPMPARYAHR